MDTFLDKHLQLVNKNNIIEIKLGKLISDNIFNGEIKYDIIKKIIKLIGDKYPNKYRSFQKKIYCKRNEEISKINNEICYSIRKNTDICVVEKLMFVKTNIQTDSIIIPSYGSFNTIQTHEIIEFTIKKMFTCSIILEDERYSVSISLYKPCNIIILKEFITSITHLY